MTDKTAQRPIECSRPTYRRDLLLAGAVFSVLLCVNLLLVGHLVFRDLGNRMRKEAISGANARAVQLARNLADQGQIDLYRVHQKITTISEYVEQILTRERYVRSVTLYDANDRPVSHWTQRGGTVFTSALGFHQPPRRVPMKEPRIEPPATEVPGDAVVGEAPTIRVDMKERDRYVAAVPIVAANGTTRRGAVEVGIDEDQLGREIDDLRRSLLIKIVAGAAVSILLLLVAFSYVVRLIRKTRRLEAEAQMADRLAYVGTLASGLAHEIRNPLNAMNMNLQMLEEEVAAGNLAADPETVGLLGSTKGEVKRLENLVNDFLAYARPTPPRLELRDLNLTVEEVVRFLRAELQRLGIQLETRLDGALPPVEIDEGQIRQAILNILVNARQVLGPGGRIEISTGLGPGGEVAVRIADNGPGIPDELRQKIFDVFYSTRGGGTGLGLPIAQRILESHGGWIDLETEVGRGTTFTLHVPSPGRLENGSAPAVAPAR